MLAGCEVGAAPINAVRRGRTGRDVRLREVRVLGLPVKCQDVEVEVGKSDRELLTRLEMSSGRSTALPLPTQSSGGDVDCCNSFDSSHLNEEQQQQRRRRKRQREAASRRRTNRRKNIIIKGHCTDTQIVGTLKIDHKLL